MSEPLPELYTATLDAATLDRLFESLTLTQVLEVRAKAAATARSGPLGLPEARAALTSGEIRALQVCYIWERETWIDTLLVTSAGTRLTRTRAPTG